MAAEMTSLNAESNEKDDINGERCAKATKDVVDMEPVLNALGPKGLYHCIQLALQSFSEFLVAFPMLGVVFIGYRPEYRCNEVNSTQLDDLIGQDISPNATVSWKYQKCSIDVTLNSSDVVTSHSLRCVNGINFSMPSDTSFLTEWSLVCDKAGLTELSQTVNMAGMAIGGTMFSSLSDLYGRKKICVICSLVALVMSSGASLAPNYYVLLVSRVMTGAFVTGMLMAFYSMFMELLPLTWRGVANPVRDCLWSLGNITMAIVAYAMQGCSWRYVNLIYSAGLLYSLLLPCFLDESLRWLMATGNISEVERILQKACRLNGKDFQHVKKVLHDAIAESRQKQNPAAAGLRKATSEEDADASSKRLIAADATVGEAGTSSGDEKKSCPRLSDSDGHSVHELESDGKERGVKSAKYTFLDILRHRVLLVPFVVITSVWTVNSLFYYGAMLGSSSLAGNRFLNYGLYAFLEIVAAVLCAFIMPRFNRRTLGIFFGMVCSLSLWFSVAMMQLVGHGIGKTLATVGWFVGKFSLTGSYCVMFVCSLEVFPTCIRTTGQGIAATLSGISAMVAPYVVLLGEDTPWAPGLMIGILCFLATLSIRLLPETRHRKLPTTIDEVKAWGSKDSQIRNRQAENPLLEHS